MYSKILYSILKSAWAIDERFAMAHGAIVANLINGFEPQISENTPEEKIETLPYFITSSTNVDVSDNMRRGYDYGNAPEGSTAVIPIVGPLMKADEDDCGVFTAGMQTIGKRIIEADEHKNIDSIILYIDTPGGTVDGTQALGYIIKNTKTPIVSFVNGLMASAGYWIGSACDSIIAENSTTEIGSIGVMLSFADMQPMWEKEGVKFHRIVADQSKDKNKEFIEVLEGKYQGYKENFLNPLASEFINTVKENRSNKISAENEKKVFTGRVYFAKDALEFGLIDEIGSLDVAVEKVKYFANKISIKNINNTKKTIDMKKFKNIIKITGIDSIEETKEGIHLSEEMLNAIEATLVSANENKEASEKVVELNKTAIEEIETKISEIDDTVKSAEGINSKVEVAVSFVNELRKGAGAETAQVIADRELAEKNKTKTVVKEDADFVENMQAIKEEYL